MSSARPTYHFRLYVAGGGARSRSAVLAVSTLCAGGCDERIDLEVIDVYHRAQLAYEDGVRGVPALVRLSPGPVRRIVGDLSDASSLLRV